MYKYECILCWWCRFDGGQFLRRWRGKKIMFVGDSLSLNQWQSLSCMVHASVPKAKTSYAKKDLLSSVTFEVSHFSFFLLYFSNFASMFLYSQNAALFSLFLYHILLLLLPSYIFDPFFLLF